MNAFSRLNNNKLTAISVVVKYGRRGLKINEYQNYYQTSQLIKKHTRLSVDIPRGFSVVSKGKRFALLHVCFLAHRDSFEKESTPFSEDLYCQGRINVSYKITFTVSVLSP